MAIILNIETATKNCSVALSNDDNLLSLKEYAGEGYSHAEKLHVFIDEIIKENKLNYNEIDAIAVSMGPGSYTGLRIGVSTAKGLAYALQIPLIAVSTLEHLAYKIKAKDAFIIPVLDARRMEVYSAIFNEDYTKIRDVKAEIVEANTYDYFLDKKSTYFVGDAVPKLKDVIQHPNAMFSTQLFPSAKEMIKPAFQKYQNSDFEDVAYFEPFYLKDFIALKKKTKL